MKNIAFRPFLLAFTIRIHLLSWRTFIFLTVITLSSNAQTVVPGWPETTNQTRPWTRWWWHGSAVTKEGITKELERLKEAGIGGVEITPIYGVHGHEKNFINYLSPEWMEMLIHVLKEAERLDLGVDMATGTGWPFGGPWVSDQDACKKIFYKIYKVKGGKSLIENIEFIQPPFFRAIGSYIYESNTDTLAMLKEPFASFHPGKIGISSAVHPIEKNHDLQSFAFDQVRFQRRLPLRSLIAYSSSGKRIDLTSHVDAQGKLVWKAPKGEWTLYALFQGWHGKMVERAAPGGEGNVVDHFSPEAIDKYLAHFDNAFERYDIKNLRSFFNDSYEVDDAMGAADWTPMLLSEFRMRRGYDLRNYLPALFGNDAVDKNERVLSDYRQTISELLTEHFTEKWKAWARKHDAIIRNQAHGSPANILDLYGLVDIPEIEGTEPLRIKMASSSANVMGKQLVSSESATWLDEHFQSNLHEVKEAVDRFMLHGVNHIFYHGTAYSPRNEPWPGWLFYAAAHFNSRNPLWSHFEALNKYVERCQSFLQKTRSDNEVLLYYPIYDRFAVPGPEMIEHFDGIGHQFAGTSFGKTAEALHSAKYTFDYISDAQLQNVSVTENELMTEGRSTYKVLLVPACRFMPLPTLRKIQKIIIDGGRVVFVGGLPKSFAGYSDFDRSVKRFKSLTKSIHSLRASNDNLKIFEDDEPLKVLKEIKLSRDHVPDSITYIRKKQEDGSKIYFINNTSNQGFEGWLQLRASGLSVVIYDPMTGEYGRAQTRVSSTNSTEVYIQLEPKQSVVVQFLREQFVGQNYFYRTQGAPIAITGEWQLEFLSGGPQIPPPLATQRLLSWTELASSEYKNFSGECAYRINFSMADVNAEAYLLDLGKVRESASVILNGRHIGTVIGPTYKIKINRSLLQQINILEVRVANLMTNRISYMDRNGIFWKKFYNVNIAAFQAENRLNGIFDASKWKASASGLLGPVTIIPLKNKSEF